jgi:hypothetical protein
LIALACLIDEMVFSSVLSLNGVNNAIGFPLFVITFYCSLDNDFQIFADEVRKSLVVTNFIQLTPYFP